MEQTREEASRERLDSARACLERLCPPAEGARRAAVVADGARRLAEYRAYLGDLERGGGEGGCRGVRGPLAERAFEAESELRVSIAEGIRSLNDLRDSGLLHLQLAELARSLEAGETDIPAILRESREELQRALDLPPAVFDEIQQVAERRLESLRYDRESDAIVVRRRGFVDGEPEEIRLRVAPRAGDIGRISLDQFFGADGRVAIQAGPPTAPPGDCHQRSGRMQDPLSLDVYAAALGGLAASREAMYRHARKVSQYGHGTAVQARDPLTTAAVVAGVALTVAAVAYIVGLVTGAGTTTVSSIAMYIALVAFVAFAIMLFLIAIFFL